MRRFECKGKQKPLYSVSSLSISLRLPVVFLSKFSSLMCVSPNGRKSPLQNVVRNKKN